MVQHWRDKFSERGAGTGSYSRSPWQNGLGWEGCRQVMALPPFCLTPLTFSLLPLTRGALQGTRRGRRRLCWSRTGSTEPTVEEGDHGNRK